MSKKEKQVVRSEEAAALNKLDSLKMDIRNFISESPRTPTDLQEYIAEHVQQEMTRDQPPAIKSGIFFLTSLMHQPPHEFYTQLIDTLREEMLSKIAELSNDINNPATVNKLRECLRTIFKMIHYPEAQPVIMKLMDTIGGKLRTDETARALIILSKDKNLYAICPLGVKRRIWKQQPELFQGEIYPMFQEYRQECDLMLRSTERVFLDQLPKERRKRDLVVKLVDMVGESSFLYARLVGWLREVYHRTHACHMCTLRAEILLSLNDRKLTALCNQDDTHHFAWVLDACVRDRWIDAKRAKELESCYQQVPEKNSRDIRMLCADPHVINTICFSIIRTIGDLLENGQLPKLSPSLRFFFVLLAIGLKIPSEEIRMAEIQGALMPRISCLLANAIYEEELQDLASWRKLRAAEMEDENSQRTANETPTKSRKETKRDVKKEEGETAPEVVDELEVANLSSELLSAKKARLCRETYLATRMSRRLLQHHCLYAVEKKQSTLACTLFDILGGLSLEEIRPEVAQAIVLGSEESDAWASDPLFVKLNEALMRPAPRTARLSTSESVSEPQPSSSRVH